MKDIGPQILQIITGWVDSRPEAAQVYEDPRVDEEQLRSPTGCDWPPLVGLHDTIEERIGRDVAVEGLVEATLGATHWKLLLDSLSAVASPIRLLELMALAGGRVNPLFHATVVPDGPLAARFILEPRRPVTASSELYFEVTGEVMRRLPEVLLGTERSVVRVETDGRSATYHVVLPPSRTMFSRLYRAWRVLLGHDPMLDLVFQQQAETLAQTHALDQHHREVEQRIAERTEVLNALNRQLGEASQNKSRHLADMSHELRTPLNAIIGYSELLVEEVREAGLDALVPDLDRIETAARYLLDLINNVLDLSKIEAGQLSVASERVELRRLVEEVGVTLGSVVSSRGNRLVVEAADAWVQGDSLRVRQILTNLVGNAAKFTEDGEIRVSVRVEPEQVSIDVRDTGAGMDPDTLERVFKPYEQAAGSHTEGFKGTGLGLPISVELAHLMGGSLTATSEPGVGSVFTLSLQRAL